MTTSPENTFHVAGDESDLEGETPKKGLTGATGGIYIGPVRPNSASHAIGAAAGGVEDSTGYRESDTYEVDSGAGVATSVVRPTGRTAYMGTGVGGSGTSVPGYPSQRANSHPSAHAYVDELGNSRSAVLTTRAPHIKGGHNASVAAVTKSTGTGPADTIAGETIGLGTGGIVRPGTSGSANPSAGTVSIIAATGKVQADLHADDITNGANGYTGCEIALFRRTGPSDAEDGDLVAKGDFDSTTAGDVTGLTGLDADTYAAYARFKRSFSQGGKTLYRVGPWSARTTVVVS